MKAEVNSENTKVKVTSKKLPNKAKRSKRTRGPVYIKYKCDSSKKRERGAIKKIRELGIITGKKYLVIIENGTKGYDAYVSHEEMLYSFDIGNISNIIVGNPNIYNELKKTSKTSNLNKDREFMPETVLNEKNPEISDPDYIAQKRNEFIEREINSNVNDYVSKYK